MDSLVDVSDSSQSPRGPATPWSPVRVNRRRGDPSPVDPPSSDPYRQHAQLAEANIGVDTTTGAQLRGSEEQLLEPTPSKSTAGSQPRRSKPNLMEFPDDEACFREYVRRRSVVRVSSVQSTDIVERLATIPNRRRITAARGSTKRADARLREVNNAPMITLLYADIAVRAVRIRRRIASKAVRRGIAMRKKGLFVQVSDPLRRQAERPIERTPAG